MNLLNKIIDYIKNAKEFDEKLALEIIEYQTENIPFYGEFLKKITGKTRFRNLSDVPPLPAHFFKTERLFTQKHHTGYFESSGTTGNRSRVYYNEDSLILYRTSSIISYPLKHRPVKTLIDISRYKSSSLSFMVNHFINTYGGKKIKNIYSEVEEGDVLFLTALQLFEFIKTAREPVNLEIHVIETGGYKKFSTEYNRHELYREARKIFRKATFFTEYGMTELFSQFYADEYSLFKDYHFLKVTEHRTGYLKVFDFANLFHISYIIVPDIISWKKDGFEYIKRDLDDERGCSYTFG